VTRGRGQRGMRIYNRAHQQPVIVCILCHGELRQAGGAQHEDDEPRSKEEHPRTTMAVHCVPAERVRQQPRLHGFIIWQLHVGSSVSFCNFQGCQFLRGAHRDCGGGGGIGEGCGVCGWASCTSSASRVKSPVYNVRLWRRPARSCALGGMALCIHPERKRHEMVLSI